MEKDEKCIQCGSKNKLFRLESGCYVCKECMDNLGKEQNEIQGYILDYLADNFQITSPVAQINVLEGIAMNIRFNNEMLDEEKMQTIREAKERMDKAFE